MILINDIQWHPDNMKLWIKERYAGQFDKGSFAAAAPMDIELYAENPPEALIHHIRHTEEFKFTITRGGLSTIYTGYELESETFDGKILRAFFKPEPALCEAESP